MAEYSAYTDQELVALLKQGNTVAFAEIFERYYPLLYSHAYNKLRSREDAMDIVQDVFVKLWNRHQRLEEMPNFTGYLYTMLRNTVLSFIYRQKTVSDYASQFEKFQEEGEASTDHRIRESQLRLIIETEIAALPPRMREVFELRRNEYLSNKEIAEKLGISEQTVEVQMKKAKKQLREKLGLLFFFMYFL
ncbi:RNA polymerase sigma factor [Pedobacter frigoris]|uniref:RNA polymerase sigma-70 factor n=1 Tax=Pedobacter frigoris TaxID=2571272 RepID=A0A4U1CQ86_9SPHI|nr:RNA polymerase sigma-70 factor [Pedobacter frigoris]TKC08975.1 RNA polymerase sigma-70 factor [Pedobacter frigoris]